MMHFASSFAATATPMSFGGILMCVPLIGLLTWAAAIDVRSRRIPNWLTLSVILTGVAQSFTWAHTASPGDAGLGLLTGFGLTFVLFAIGALGGGDVKLLAGVGAWLGPWHTLQIFAAAAIIGMLIVLVQAAAQRRVLKLFRNSAVIAMTFAHAGPDGLEQAAETGKSCSSTENKPLPYAVPVLLSTALVIFSL
jgi:prepilin peptidase CpaA